jgi:hypothetical protein
MIRYFPWIVLGLAWTIPAAAVELPTRKAGLWDIKMQIEGQHLPMNTIQQCTDASTDKLMTAGFGNAMQACEQKNISESGGKIVVDSVCNIGGGTATSHAEISGDFNSAYTVKVTSKQEGGRAMSHLPAGGEMHMTMEAKWVGPCAKGQRPGDVIMPGGIKINVKQMMMKP